MSDPEVRDEPTRSVSAVVVIAVAIVMFAYGFVVYLTGDELAFILMIAGFGLFTLGFGTLVASSK